MARRTVSKHTTIGLAPDIVGWLEWASRESGQSMAAYIDALMRADRDRRMRDADASKRYRAYLEAMGMADELDALEA